MTKTLLMSLGMLVCINTSYSVRDEQNITSDTRLLVIGAFAHHGPAFYEAELKRCHEILSGDPDNFDARNDLGAALTKLRRYEEAEAEFQQNEQLHPGRYQTASNLGVLYKKWDRFEDASEWIAKALEIKPGGHMGLGDYYLRMINWKAEHARAGGLPPTNFLGVKYTAGPHATAKVANREYVETLIKNDMSFADAYLVLGDIALFEDDLQTALRSYLRATQISGVSHSDRVQRVYARLEEKMPDQVHAAQTEWPNQIHTEFNTAEAWLTRYQEIEAERIESGQAVDFETMREATAVAGLQAPVVKMVIYDEQDQSPTGRIAKWGMILSVLGGISLAIVVAGSFFIRRIFMSPKADAEVVLDR